MFEATKYILLFQIEKELSVIINFGNLMQRNLMPISYIEKNITFLTAHWKISSLMLCICFVSCYLSRNNFLLLPGCFVSCRNSLELRDDKRANFVGAGPRGRWWRRPHCKKNREHSFPRNQDAQTLIWRKKKIVYL